MSTQTARNSVILNNRYEVLERIASGSMGTVYLCRNTIMSDRVVAVKVLAPEIALDEIALSRFASEIEASYDVTHPNVVRTYEYFQDDDVFAFSMEYVDGGDLAQRIQVRELSFPEIKQFLLQICDGLSAIHRAGIVHRDLKPENILLTKGGQVKIADFGVAHLNYRPRRTGKGVLVGALDYLSPEYVSESKVDERSDIYALGMLTYKMIARRLPFEGKSFLESIRMRVETELPAPSSVRPSCPKEFDEIVAKAIRRNADERYQRVEEFRADLEKLDLESLQESYFQPSVKPEIPTPIPSKRPEENSLRSGFLAFFHGGVAGLVVMLVGGFLLGEWESFREKNADISAALKIGFAAMIDDPVVYETPKETDELPLSLPTPQEAHAKEVSVVVDSSPGVLPLERVQEVVAAQQQDERHHVVRFRGETLSIIANWYFGDSEAWKKIAAINPNLDPSHIQLGDKIVLPAQKTVHQEPFERDYVKRFGKRSKTGNRS